MITFELWTRQILKCVKNVSKNLNKNRDPMCTSVTQETPILKIWALS